MFNVVDGQAGPVFDMITWPTWLPDGAIEYAAAKGMVSLYVDNGAPHEITGTMVGGPLPYKGHLAYEATLGNKTFAVLDGKPEPLYDSIGSIEFSPDGKHFAYSAKTGNQWQLIIDGQPGSLFDLVAPFTPYFSADSQHWAHWATSHDKRFVVMDGKPGPEFDNVGGFTRLVFSRDGKHLAYIGQKGRKSVLVVDGHEGPETDGYISDGPNQPRNGGGFDQLPPFFTPDTDHLVYLINQSDGKIRVCIDSEMGPVHGVLYSCPSIRSDGKLEYVASGDKMDSELYRVTISFSQQ